jgi:hypothetical protein
MVVSDGQMRVSGGGCAWFMDLWTGAEKNERWNGVSIINIGTRRNILWET